MVMHYLHLKIPAYPASRLTILSAGRHYGLHDGSIFFAADEMYFRAVTKATGAIFLMTNSAAAFWLLNSE